ncbi:hypothetical protein R6Z07F_001499 [Ovis aries]
MLPSLCPSRSQKLRSLRNLSQESLVSPAAAAAAKLLQSCPTLCDPIDGSPPGSPVPGILQARTLEWVAIFFSSALRSNKMMEQEEACSVLVHCNPLLAAHT